MPDEVISVPMVTTSELEQQIAELKKKNDELSHALFTQSAAHERRAELIQGLYRAAFFMQWISLLSFIETRANECNIELPDFLGNGKENRFDMKEVVNVALTADAMQQDRAAIGADAKEATKRVLTKFTEG